MKGETFKKKRKWLNTIDQETINETTGNVRYRDHDGLTLAMGGNWKKSIG